MIKSVGDEPIFSLLSPDHKVVYQVPQYQREYSWSRQQWDDLFDDLLEADLAGSGHFLGIIICVNRTRNTTHENVLELVDGQQRMITLSYCWPLFTNFSRSAAPSWMPTGRLTSILCVGSWCLSRHHAHACGPSSKTQTTTTISTC